MPVTQNSKILNTFAEVGNALHYEEDIDNILNIILTRIVALFEAKGSCLRVLNQKTNELELKSSFGLSQDYIDKGKVYADVGISEIYENSIVYIKDIEKDKRVQYPQIAKKEGIVSIVAVPLKIFGSIRMVLRVFFGEEKNFSKDELDVLKYIATQSAMAIKNSMLQTRYFEAFQKTSSAIHSGKDVEDILKQIVNNIKDVMEARGAVYWIVNTSLKSVHMKVSSGFLIEELTNVDYKILENVFNFNTGKPIYFNNIEKENRLPTGTAVGKKMVVSVLGMPFSIIDNYTGILAVYFGQYKNFTEKETEFIRSLGEQGAIALHKAFRYDEKMFKTLTETIEGLVLALEAKDIYTHGHSKNVARLSKIIAQKIGLTEKEAEIIYHAGLLHDIGKIAMSNQILDNLGKLNYDEYEKIRKHPEISARILQPLSFLNEVIPLVRSHHERFDGTGYPDGLLGEQIPIGARIIAVADAFDAMVSDRPNSEGLEVKKALEQLKTNWNISFDKKVVEAFCRVVEENPEIVKPFKTETSYFQKYKNELKEKKNKGWSNFNPFF